MEDNRKRFKIDAEYNNSKKKFEYILYMEKKLVWVEITRDRNVNKLYRIIDKLNDYPKYLPAGGKDLPYEQETNVDISNGFSF